MTDQMPGQTPGAGQATPPVSHFSRLTDVIVAPGKAFESIVKQPTWLFPALIYMAVLVASLAIFSTKADWVAIDTSLIESMVGKIAPEQAVDQAVRETTTLIKRFSPGQLVLFKTLERSTGLPLFLHCMALIYATLFVFMGSFPSLKLGSAWLGFLLGILIFIGYAVVNLIANLAFKNAPASQLLISASGGIIMVVAWLWLMTLQAKRHPEFHRVLAVCAHAMVVPAIGSLALIGAVVAAPPGISVAPETFVKSSLGAFIDVGSPVLQSILNSLDLFTLLFMGILTVGFRAATKLSLGLAASITWLPWAVIVMVKVAFRAIFG